jgi:hypothetical protein
MPRWLESLIILYLITRSLGGASLFFLVIYLILNPT